MQDRFAENRKMREFISVNLTFSREILLAVSILRALLLVVQEFDGMEHYLMESIPSASWPLIHLANPPMRDCSAHLIVGD